MGNAFDRAYHLAVRYLATRARSILEMETYLARKKMDPDTISAVITRLTDDRYLDDRAFADQFIRNRIRFKPKSKFALGYELKAKGVSQDISDQLLAPYDDLDLAKAAIRPRQAQWQGLDREAYQKKLLNYLRYRGFGHSTCMAVWSDLDPGDSG